MAGELKLRFLGADRNVTGSCHMVDADGFRFIVDCGIYQERDLRQRNWEPFPIPPGSIDAVLLTHGHLDHCGLLPKLVKEGFRGKVHCTSATTEIAGIVIQDSARIQEEDAAFKRKRHQSEGRQGPHPEAPLYTVADAEACLPRLTSIGYGETLSLADGVQATFRDAGHILGSAMIEVVVGAGDRKRKLVFSGDVGRWDAPILRDPASFGQADYVLIESTYGNRLHGTQASIPEALAAVVNDTAAAGGKLIVPSFAVERTQDLLYHLNNLLVAKRIPRMPVYVDSPMAIKVTEVFKRHLDLFDAETARLIREGHHPCDFPGMALCRTADESKAINAVQGSCIIIAGSGMCTGGRIKHHLAQQVGKPENTVLFIGYQAAGTLGRTILEGAKIVRVLGKEYDVRARVEKINGFSAHADRDELFRWISSLRQAPRRVFVIHGESQVADSFASWLHQRTAWPTAVANYGEEIRLD